MANFQEFLMEKYSCDCCGETVEMYLQVDTDSTVHPRITYRTACFGLDPAEMEHELSKQEASELVSSGDFQGRFYSMGIYGEEESRILEWIRKLPG